MAQDEKADRYRARIDAARAEGERRSQSMSLGSRLRTLELEVTEALLHLTGSTAENEEALTRLLFDASLVTSHVLLTALEQTLGKPPLEAWLEMAGKAHQGLVPRSFAEAAPGEAELGEAPAPSRIILTH